MKTYRVYFNCRQEHPRIWSYDEGPGTEEHKIKDVLILDCSARTAFDPDKHPPKDASAWFNVTGYVIEEDGMAIFSSEAPVVPRIVQISAHCTASGRVK